MKLFAFSFVSVETPKSAKRNKGEKKGTPSAGGETKTVPRRKQV
jgi:hypothetical protein